jgi:ribonuclease HI
MNEIAKTDAKQHLVVYSDGGAWPVNPGFGGWGVHGYLFSEEKPKKGTGLGKWVVTNAGYVDKTQNPEAVPVTPIGYVDGFGSFALAVTNQVTELEAATQAMTFAAQYDLESFTLFSDSRYVVDGLTKGWVDKWKANNWIKTDGNPVANMLLWQSLHAAFTSLQQRGTRLTLNWIKGHSGHRGNDSADYLASLGENYSHQAQGRLHEVRTYNAITVTGPDGYWKSDVERHPFLNLPYVLFTTDRQRWVPNKYYQVTTAKEVEQIGRRARDGSFAIVELDQASPVIDTVMNAHAELEEDVHLIIAIDNNAIHRGEMHDFIIEHGSYALRRRKPHRDDLEALDKTLVSYQQAPALLSYRAIDKLEEYNLVFEAMKAGVQEIDGVQIVQTDLTSILYDTSVKQKKKGKGKVEPEVAVEAGIEQFIVNPEDIIMTLKSEYKVGFAKLDVQANYRDEDEVKQLPLSIMLGIDLLDRNSLKRLETMLPKVTLLTWRSDDLYFNYATFIKTDIGNNVGLWSGIYTNQRIIPEQ